eukprot:CAMPEP_0194360276 /NCGR_PEP_ID=MMETSP0174-20130528/7573_1 /TAXON_ID=216777 /ORGANISM="Proboscia alata, Strain PI-D3" /LENGTH=890 /DNA_ID=CAMNT_0039131661 /DNA_START=106 /DNA_END=2775 /DNA_ORIENTATION=-
MLSPARVRHYKRRLYYQSKPQKILSLFLKIALLSQSQTYSIGDDGFCPLVAFLPFTYNGEEIRTGMAFSHMIAALMAAEDFNARHSTVISPTIFSKAYDRECTVTFPINEPDGFIVANTEGTGNNVAASLLTGLPENGLMRNGPCAIVGGYFNLPTLTASQFATGWDIPLISHGSDDIRLGREHFGHTRATRTSVDLSSISSAVIAHLKHIDRTEFLGIIYSSVEDGTSYAETLKTIAKTAGFNHVQSVKVQYPYTGFKPDRSVRHAMSVIKKKDYRTIVVAITHYEWVKVIPLLADAAEEFGTNGEDYVWMLAGSVDLDQWIMASGPLNTNVTKFLKGVGIIRPIDRFSIPTVDGKEDPFLQSWRRRGDNSSFGELVNRINPIIEGSIGYYNIPTNSSLSRKYFETVLPEPGAGFIYDAVMAIGLGACSAQKRGQQQLKQRKRKIKSDCEDSCSRAFYYCEQKVGCTQCAEGLQDQNSLLTTERGCIPGCIPTESMIATCPTLSDNAIPIVSSNVEEDSGNADKEENSTKYSSNDSDQDFDTGNMHLNGILSTTFFGASGKVIFGEKTGFVFNIRNRPRDSITYGLYNVYEHLGGEEAAELSFHLTDIVQNVSIDYNEIWTSFESFIYYDGTTSPPVLLRGPPEQNYLSSSVRAGGLSLMAFSIFLSAASMVFVFLYRNSNTIKASQPIFLYCLAFGSALMSCGIFTLSFDESHGWNELALSHACMSTPWLLVLGFIIIYSGLFSKLWRINKILQYSQKKVEVKHVAGPFAALTLSVVVVLTCWTILDHYSWVRKETNIETGETYGRCASKNTLAYTTPIGLLMSISVIMTFFMSWKTKDIVSKFSESSWIFYTIFLQVQIYIFGIPILIVLDKASANATYLLRVMLIW